MKKTTENQIERKLWINSKNTPLHLVYIVCIFIINFTNLNEINAQYPNVDFTNQQQIDDFPDGSLTTVGTVYISGNDIVNLNGLAQITSIKGSLNIIANPLLQNLSGLHNLSHIGESLGIINNSNLVDISALSGITAIGSSSEVPNNLSQLNVLNNPSLLSLNGLHNIQTVANTLFDEGTVDISQNNALTNLIGLESLDHIGEFLYIKDNANLASLSGLNSLTSVDIGFTIENNPSLTSLSGFPSSLSNVSLGIIGNDNLTSFIPLNVANISSLTINDNDALVTLNGLAGLSSISSLSISGNDALSSLQLLEDLTSCNVLFLSQNNALISLSGLDNIDPTSMSYLQITNSSMLSICEVSSICQYLDNGGTAVISSNATGCNSQSQIETACLEPPSCNSSLYRPSNGSLDVLIDQDLNWWSSPNSTGYKLTVGTTPEGTEILNNFDVGDVTNYDVGVFPINSSIYVSIVPYNTSGDAIGCAQEMFTTGTRCMANAATFSSQAEIDDFPTNYPGCTCIAGNFLVEESTPSDIVNLNGFSSIDSIGNFSIINNAALTNLSGLENLISAGFFYFTISNNSSLENINALNNLTIIGDDLISFDISNNPVLTSLEGINNVALFNPNNDFLEVNITNSPLLSTCEVSSVCDFLDNGGSATISGNAVGCNSQTEVEMACLSALPVELKSFYANVLNNGIELKWKTSTELNSDVFYIQHSKDGLDFYTISLTAASGNTTTEIEYNAFHQTPNIGPNYYRLKMVDYDGQFDYSSVIVSHFNPNSLREVTLYPNPSKNHIIVKGEKDEIIHTKLYDSFGQLVIAPKSEILVSDNKLVIDISTLNQGVYILKTKTTAHKVYVVHTP